MRVLEGVLLWSAIALYLWVFLVCLSGIVFKKKPHEGIAWKLYVAGFIAHTLTIVVRWVASGHPPVHWTFEHSLAGGWFVAGVFLLTALRYEHLRVAGVVVAPFVMLMLGYGIMKQSTDISPLSPPYQSNWLWVHVGFAWVAYGAYHVAAVAAGLYLLKDRALRKYGEEKVHGFYRALPDLGNLDDVIYKLIIYGFIAHIVMLGAGALWAYGLWGRYWAWDPIETWTLVSWLIYGLNLHLRANYGWTGTRGAWLAIVSLLGVIIFFGGIGFVGGVHTAIL